MGAMRLGCVTIPMERMTTCRRQTTLTMREGCMNGSYARQGCMIKSTVREDCKNQATMNSKLMSQ